jgi:hypothetical protein
MLDAGTRFDEPCYRSRGLQNLRFVLQAQNADGSWLYAVDNPGEAFIDHFHTCFVLKNLLKMHRISPDADIVSAIRGGYANYRETLFDERGEPRSFAIAPRRDVVKLEMYNFAEAITLGTLLRDEIPEAYVVSQRLAGRLARLYQQPAGYFVTRVYKGGLRHTLPYLRWPQAQLFYALTNLLRATAGGPDSRN